MSEAALHPPEQLALEQRLYEVLAELGVAYEHHPHEAAYTVEEADRLYGHLPGGHSKNLFLRNKKGDTQYLVVVESAKRVNLKALQEALGESKLSMGSPERLLRTLALTPGSVTPLALLNEGAREVKVVLDEGLLRHDPLNFHPNVNTATISLARADFERFLAHCGNEVRRLEVPE